MVKLTLVDGGEEWVNPAQVTRVNRDTRWEDDRATHVYIRGEPTLAVKGAPEEIAKLLSIPAAPIVVNVSGADDPNRVAEAMSEVLGRVAAHRSKAPLPPNPTGKPGRPADHAAEHLQ